MWRIGRDSRGTEKPAANENSESMLKPAEFPTANPISQTDAEVAELLEQEKLTELCSNAGFSKKIEKRQFFITLDDDTLHDLKRSCRESILLRREKSSHVRGWIRGNTKIGRVMDVKVCYHQGRYGVEIVIESLSRDRTVSWVRILNRINKHETETSETISLENVDTELQGNLLRRQSHNQSLMRGEQFMRYISLYFFALLIFIFVFGFCGFMQRVSPKLFTRTSTSFLYWIFGASVDIKYGVLW